MEICEMDTGIVVAFLGTWGLNGILIWREARGWEFHAHRTVAWDAAHQARYRNFRATGLTAEDLALRGISLPSEDLYNKPVTRKRWSDNFVSAVVIGSFPVSLVQRLSASPVTVHLILSEDLYESRVGDGKFLYPQAAFWNSALAQRELERLRQGQAKATPGQLGYNYTIKEIEIRLDPGAGTVLADLAINEYEHYDLKGLLRLLAAARET